MVKTILMMMMVALLNAACSVQKAQTTNLVAKQGIIGYVLQISGNRMPSKGVRPIVPKGIMATICVYEKTNTDQIERSGSAPLYSAIHTKQIATVTTDSTGKFTVLLPVGTYSVFIKKPNGYYANRFDEKNNINVVIVDKKKLTEVTIMDMEGATF